jgi:hypothetical protein
VPHAVDRFDGEIAGLGSGSGTRIVLGLWPDTPFGPIADAMVETAGGHRVLIAPTAEVGDYIAATYHFDEVRVEQTALQVTATLRRFSSASLSVTVQVARRTVIGRLLRLVPRPLARSRLWCRLVDPVARLLRAGVRTVGTAGGGRREYYCALDEHALGRIDGSWDGAPLGELRPVTPPVRFGFGSTPAAPSIVRITTLIET